MGAVITNKNTSQSPMTATGLTGAQSEFFIPAGRLYIKTLDAVATPIIVKSNGVTPTGFTDLGTMMDAGKVAYTKNTVKLTRGIDKKLGAIYVDTYSGTFECNLGQFDDVVLSAVSGLTPYTVTAGSIVRFAIGAESVVQKAVLLVSQNKVDGKEHQYYHPNAFMTFDYTEVNNQQVVKVSADMPLFTMDAVECLFAHTIFA